MCITGFSFITSESADITQPITSWWTEIQPYQWKQTKITWKKSLGTNISPSHKVSLFFSKFISARSKVKKKKKEEQMLTM